MELHKDLASVLSDEGLSRLPEIAAKYGFYGAFVNWKPPAGSKDAGIYFVMSPNPIDPNINIRDLTMLLTKSSAICTKYWLEEIPINCKDNNAYSQSIVNETMQYAEKMATVRSIFDDYGPDVEIPEFIDCMQLGDLTRTFALSQYSTEPGKKRKNIPLDVYDMRATAMADLRKYCDRMRNVQEKYSKNPILRKLKVPNRDFLREQYTLNPRLKWSKYPWVRAYRWLRYRNSQKIPKNALLELSYGENGICRYTLFGKHRDLKTGKMVKTGNYQEFKKLMEKYPDILYCIKKEKTFKSYYAKVKEGIPNPFRGKPTYEERFEVFYCRRHSYIIYPLLSRLANVDDYRDAEPLHPVSIEELKKSNQRLVAKYINLDNDVLRNVALKCQANGIPYAIDDGSVYSSDVDGSVAVVFREEDSWFPEWAIAKTISDYGDMPGEKKWPDSCDKVRGPEIEAEPNQGFDFLRRENEIDTAIMTLGNSKVEVEMSR